MFGLRSARGRAILAGVVLVALLASVAALAVWRAHDDQQRHHSLEHTSTAALALESVQAQFQRELTMLSALVFSDDPALLDKYQDAAAAVEQHLSQARAAALAAGEADKVAALDDLTARIGQFNDKANLDLSVLLGADPETRAQLAAASMSTMVAEAEAIIADLEALVDEEQDELAAERAAADRAADTTLWLLIGFSAATFVVAVGAIAMLIVSVVRPLVSLQASAKAITSGDPEARAKVYGPEEVASLARAFNAMTDALAAKTKEYIDTTNLTGDIIVKLDKDGRCIFLNDVACQFLGRPREDILGAEIARYLHPEDVEPTTQTIRQMIKSKGLIRGIVSRFVTPVGIRVTEWNAYPLFDEQGQYAGLQGTGRDITERKRAEEALRTKDSALESSISAIALADLQGNLTYVNRSFLKIWGYDDDTETLGKPAVEFWQMEEKALEIVEALRDRGSWVGELTATRRDGSAFDVQLSASMVTDDVGKPICMMSSFVDITERKRAEEAVRESEGRYRSLVEASPDAIILSDLNTNIIMVNDRAVRLLGYDNAEEVIGRNSLEFIAPEDRQRAAENTLRTLQTGVVQSVEYTLLRKDGTSFPGELSASSIVDAQGRPQAFTGVLRNITERKRAEEARERLHAELELRAITDSLTGLYNHAHFLQRLAEEIKRSKRYGRGFTVVMMDVDNFKHYNDSRGHQAGDKALRLISYCIRSGLRRSDIAFRYDGDEFAAILPHADSSKAGAVVNRINRHITRRLKQTDKGTAVPLSLSAGVACFPDDGATADDLVRIADAALYSTKRLAWARAATERGQAIEPLDEKQQRVLCPAAKELAKALRDLSVPDVLADLDLSTVAAVGAAVEIKDPYIHDHQERVSRWAAALAEEMGLPPERVRDIRIAGLLHDIGKVSISEGILNKPGKLTEEEYAKVKEHSALGATIVAHVEGLQRLVKAVRHHHECFDGTGYPDGLAGEDIPLEARILAVVDVFDAMTHERSYRKAQTREQAITELERRAGTQFDPAVVKAFLKLLQKRGEPTAPAQAASKHRQLATARAGGRRKG